MTGISFIIPTNGSNNVGINQIIDSIEVLNIPKYEVILVGGLVNTIHRKNTIHIPFDETATPFPWITRKKNVGVNASQYEVVVVMHDYHVFDSNWYKEFEKFGTDWDICIQQQFTMPEQGSMRGNGWRAGPIPGYPEIPPSMTIPWDIDCFIPYMAIQGAFWVAKRSVMIETPMNDYLLWGQSEDIDWSSRVVPGWLGQKPEQNRYKIVANPNCVARFNKEKPPYPGDPNFFVETSKSLNWLWDQLRRGFRRPGVYHYERSSNSIVLSN
jgi:hypothetical protein